jgi:hypothetical protein
MGGLNMKFTDEGGPVSSMELEAFENFITAHGRIWNKFPAGTYIARVAGRDGSSWEYDNEVFALPGDRERVDWFTDWMDGFEECRVIWIVSLEEIYPDYRPREIIHFTEKDAYNEWTQEVIE